MKLTLKNFKGRLKAFLSRQKQKINFLYEMDYPKHKILMHDNVRVLSCKKEPDTVRWIEGFGRNDTAFDIGANVGGFSLLMSLYCARVYAFEPAFMNFDLLCRNVAVNVSKGLIPNNVYPINIAFGEKTAVETLSYTTFKLGNSGHQIGGGTQFQPVFKQGILCFSMDSLIGQFGIAPPNHIKLDVDGIELAILKGGGHTLQHPNLKSLLVETQNERERAVITEYVRGKGLLLSAKFNTDPAGLQQESFNCLYTRKS